MTIVVKITRITSPQVTNNQIIVTCEAVGYPNPSVDWQDCSGNVINNLTQTVTDLHTYETTYSLTFTVSQDDCQGCYSCSARNRNNGAVITLTRSVDVCIEGKFMHDVSDCMCIDWCNPF